MCTPPRQALDASRLAGGSALPRHCPFPLSPSCGLPLPSQQHTHSHTRAPVSSTNIAGPPHTYRAPVAALPHYPEPSGAMILCPSARSLTTMSFTPSNPPNPTSPHLTPRTRLPPTPPFKGPLLEGVRHTHVCTQEKAAFGVHDPCDCTAKGRLVWANGDAYEGQVRLQYSHAVMAAAAQTRRRLRESGTERVCDRERMGFLTLRVLLLLPRGL